MIRIVIVVIFTVLVLWITVSRKGKVSVNGSCNAVVTEEKVTAVATCVAK